MFGESHCILLVIIHFINIEFNTITQCTMSYFTAHYIIII